MSTRVEVNLMARAPRRTSAEQVESLARRIWLAGLGAYGQSLEDAQQHLDRAGGEASRLFQELVEKGQRIEEQSRSGIRKSIDDARSAISGRVGTNARSLEEMIRRVRDKVGLDAALSGRLDALARRVDGLAQALGLPTAGSGRPSGTARRRAPHTAPAKATTGVGTRKPTVRRAKGSASPAVKAAPAARKAGVAGKGRRSGGKAGAKPRARRSG